MKRFGTKKQALLILYERYCEKVSAGMSNIALHLSQNANAADTGSTRASLAYRGAFYGNVAGGVHGQSSRDFPKHRYNFDMNPGARFEYSTDEEPVDDFNLLTTYPDKAKVRNIWRRHCKNRSCVPISIAVCNRWQPPHPNPRRLSTRCRWPNVGRCGCWRRKTIAPISWCFKKWSARSTSNWCLPTMG